MRTIHQHLPNGEKVDTPIDQMPTKSLLDIHNEVGGQFVHLMLALIDIHDELEKRNALPAAAPAVLKAMMDEMRAIRAARRAPADASS